MYQDDGKGDGVSGKELRVFMFSLCRFLINGLFIKRKGKDQLIYKGSSETSFSKQLIDLLGL